MEPQKLKMSDLRKMEKGEIPMTEEGQRRLTEMKEMGDKLKASISAAQNAINPVIVDLIAARKTAQSAIVQFHTGQAAAKLAVSSMTANIKGFQESMRPFIEQMAKAFKVVDIVKGRAEEVYENEKRFFEENYHLRIRDYDIFWHWLCEEIDRLIFDKGDENVKLDYESIVDYYGQFCNEQITRRHSFIKGKVESNATNEARISVKVDKLENTDKVTLESSISTEYSKQENRLDKGEDTMVSTNDVSKYPPEREPFISTPTKTLSSLLRKDTRYESLAQLAKISEVPLPIYAPDYKLAQRIYDKRFPTDTDREDKIWISYCDSYTDFEEEFDHKLDSLFQDKEGRIAYLKRVFDQLHSYPSASESLNKLSTYLFSEPCRSKRKNLDLESTLEIVDIMDVLNASLVYIKSVSIKIERQFEIEGIPLENGWLADEKRVDSPQQTTNSNRTGQQKSKPQNIKDIWLGDEAEFWRIVKTYANNYIEDIDGRITWTKQNSGITYLAGFTYECQQKGWISKNLHSAPDFRRVYENAFNITFDEKPFKLNNLNTIGPIYRDPFKGIQHKVK